MLPNNGSQLGKADAVSAVQIYGKVFKAPDQQQHNGNYMPDKNSSLNPQSESNHMPPLQKKFAKLVEKEMKANKQTNEQSLPKASESAITKHKQTPKQSTDAKKRLHKEAATQDNLLEAPIFNDEYLKYFNDKFLFILLVHFLNQSF